ncbi:hypothetical protein GW17_00028174, partial [Ensete ventricosum]
MYPNITPLLGTGNWNRGGCGLHRIPCLGRGRRQDEASVDPRREGSARVRDVEKSLTRAPVRDRGWILAAGPASDETATMSDKRVITYKRKRSSSQSDLTKARKDDSSEKTEQELLPNAELDTSSERFDQDSV